MKEKYHNLLDHDCWSEMVTPPWLWGWMVPNLPFLLTDFCSEICRPFYTSLPGKIMSPTFLWSDHKVSPADSCQSHLSCDTVTLFHRGICAHLPAELELCGGQWSYLMFCEGEIYWNHNICICCTHRCFNVNLFVQTWTTAAANIFVSNENHHVNIQIFLFSGVFYLAKGHLSNALRVFWY